jgi:putative ubiquitin-RnfH superfamily antitoxin RatB of RatAB toxin-antitoxin module
MAEIHVQVCCPFPGRPLLRELALAEGSTLRDAVHASGLLRESGLEGLDIEICQVGVFGRKKTPDTVLREGDRVEIYRPLLADPKEARRRRAVKNAGPKP